MGHIRHYYFVVNITKHVNSDDCQWILMSDGVPRKGFRFMTSLAK